MRRNFSMTFTLVSSCCERTISDATHWHVYKDEYQSSESFRFFFKKKDIVFVTILKNPIIWSTPT